MVVKYTTTTTINNNNNNNNNNWKSFYIEIPCFNVLYMVFWRIYGTCYGTFTGYGSIAK